MKNYCRASCGRCSRAVADETEFFNSSVIIPSNEPVNVATPNSLSSTGVGFIIAGGFVVVVMIVLVVALSWKPVKAEETV